MRLLTSIMFIALLAAPLAPAQAALMKIATLAPDGSEWMNELHKGADEIAQRTDGRVKLRIYAGGVMGSDRVVLRKIRAGQLQGGALTGGALADIYPGTHLYSLPMVFRSYGELDYVRAHMDKELAQGLEKAGFVTFGFTDGGFAYLMSSSPIRNTADLKSQKVWVPEGDEISRAMFDTLGSASVPLPLTDVLTGLQTGLITTVGAPAQGAIALQWHTRVKYLVDVPTEYVFGALAVDKKFFSGLAPADQAVVRGGREGENSQVNRKGRAGETADLEGLRQRGSGFPTLPPAEVATLGAAADQTINKLTREGVVSAALVKELRGYLKDYRRSHPGQ